MHLPRPTALMHDDKTIWGNSNYIILSIIISVGCKAKTIFDLMASAVAVIVMAVMAVVVVAIVAVMVAVVTVVMVAIVAVVASMVTASVSAGELFGGFWKEKECKCLREQFSDEGMFKKANSLPSAKTHAAQRRARMNTAFMILRREIKLSMI